jgi:DNA-binding MarR family transcriptional regulator|tara:strand:- start:1846 stop:2502 length:657 start_codon:yes stop_codon:yes gene_type:complete
LAKTETDSPDLDNESRITLGLLNVVHDNAATSQRSMADDLGIALGLANAYLKRCVKKGLIKVSQAPANRYAYYLTPKGFTEKSRLTAEFLSQSFNLFRRARTESAELFSQCQSLGWNRVALYGLGDLTEIMTLSARDFDIELVAVISKDTSLSDFAGLPVIHDIPRPEDIDAVIICNIVNSQESYDDACAHFPPERVLVLRFLGVSGSSGVGGNERGR